MKKLVLALTLVAFALAVQAGEGKTCSKDKVACADKDKAACAAKAEATGCCLKSASKDKAACAKAQTAKKEATVSPKAAGELTAAK